MVARIELVEPSTEIIQPDTPGCIPVSTGRAFSVVFDGDLKIAVVAPGIHRYLSALRTIRDTVLDRILNERLNEHCGDQRLQRFRINFVGDIQTILEQLFLDFDVVPDELQ